MPTSNGTNRARPIRLSVVTATAATLRRVKHPRTQRKAMPSTDWTLRYRNRFQSSESITVRSLPKRWSNSFSPASSRSYTPLSYMSRMKSVLATSPSHRREALALPRRPHPWSRHGTAPKAHMALRTFVINPGTLDIPVLPGKVLPQRVAEPVHHALLRIGPET